MTKHLLTLSILALTLSVHAQQPKFFQETWAEHPVIHTVDARFSTESAIILRDLRRVEYNQIDSQKYEKYRTVHRIIHVIDDKGIESFNKIYIGYTDTSDILAMRARAILPNGSIREISRSDMKDINEDGKHYKIFAMEGLEKGSEVEFYYTVRSSLNFFGEESLQGSFPILDAQLEIVGPKDLIFQLHGYNSNITVSDTTNGGKKIVSTRLTDIPGAEKEKYSAYNASLRRVEYRLSYNSTSASDRIRLNTWNMFAQRIHEMYETFSEKDLKRVDDVIETNDWQKLTDDRQKIIAVENYLKKQFTTRKEIDNENAGKIDWMIKNKIASHYGMIRLYAAIYTKLGIDHQIVVTCDRNERSIDRSFENWDNADEFLFYFPSTKKFLAPLSVYMRYPWFSPNWAATDGVFCQSTTIGNYTTAIAVIKKVPLADFGESYSKLVATFRFNTRLDSLIVNFKEADYGYPTLDARAAFALSNAEQRQKLLQAIARMATNSEKLISSKVENDKIEDCIDNKPLLLEEDILTDGLLENAGKNILVRIGQIIGQQTEMYHEKPRQFAISLDYPHTEERFIDFIIPPGYMIKNPNDLTVQQEYKTDGVTTLGFVTDYKIDGDTLHIHVMETYRYVTYPLSEYENFRKVINAGADFNKLTLVLIPK